MTNKLNFDVFISYRRAGGEVLARLLFELLKDKYNVFFDHESLTSGRFDKKLLDIIEGCNDVIVILSKDCLDRCVNDGDWFMSEINCALEHNKNIILLMTEDFYMPAGTELLAYSAQIQSLLKYHGHRISVAYIDSIITKLCNELKTPVHMKTGPFESISEWSNFNNHLQDKHFTANLPEQLKLSIVRNSIFSFLDEYNAKIINSIVERLTDKIYNVRTKFNYEIDIRSDFNFKIVDIDCEKYYEMDESLSYSKTFRGEKPEKTFWISFATNLDELDSSLHAESFFFSENLMVDMEDMKLLSDMDEEEKLQFYNSVMRIKININGHTLTAEKVIIDKSGIFGQYSLPDGIFINTDSMDVKIRFRMPQRYTNSFFFACLSEPTYSPFIRFSYEEDAFNVEMIPFLNRSLTAKDTKVFDGVRELSIENEWILPVSGAIFLINKI